MRRIQIRFDYFCLGIILEVIQYNFQNNAKTKIVKADLDFFSPRAFQRWPRKCRSPPGSLVNCFFCRLVLKVQSSCSTNMTISIWHYGVWRRGERPGSKDRGHHVRVLMRLRHSRPFPFWCLSDFQWDLCKKTNHEACTCRGRKSLSVGSVCVFGEPWLELPADRFLLLLLLLRVNETFPFDLKLF